MKEQKAEKEYRNVDDKKEINKKQREEKRKECYRKVTVNLEEATKQKTKTKKTR